ncbi:MAG: hypothetical protein HUU20_14950 [Pirellulales bacterium]|nr:hypothetical protein [Pirellulales bacterium]
MKCSRRTTILRLPWIGKGLLGVFLGFLIAGAARCQSTAEFQVYPLRHKAAPEVEKLLRQMLPDQAAQVVSDAQRNQILLRGAEDVQQIARQLIESVDRPEAVRPASKPVVKAYPIDPARLNETANSLRARYGGHEGVRIAGDESTSKLLILAPPEVHEAIDRQLSGIVPPPAKPERAVLTEPVGRPKQQFVPVIHSRPDEVEARLLRVLGSRLSRLPQQQPGQAPYLYSDAQGRRAELRADMAANGVHVIGPEAIVDQLSRLIYVLDNPSAPGGESLSVVPLPSVGPIRQAIGSRRNNPGRSPGQPIPFDGPGGVVPIPTHPGPEKSSSRTSHVGADLVAHLFQPVEAPAAGAKEEPKVMAVEPISPAEEQEIQQRLERLRELGQDVQVETLPDLDVLILRGRQRDVEEMRRIIEEIERLSAEAEPTIDIYYLKQVGGEAVADIVDQVKQVLLGGRQGRVDLVPLVKPNALLLIGWGEALKVAKELIEKLDRPVLPGSQLRVFRLKHTPATAAETTVQEFFANRRGLGANVQVMADVRTNSLIVQASPRDLEEVALLVRRIDVGQSEAVNQVRVFTLENSLAADLADTLQDAIRGQRTGAATGQKSAVLELLTVDAQGAKLLKSGILNDVSITPDVRMNTLIVSAPAESMDLIAALIQQLDSPTSVAQIKVFSVVNGDASSMILMLRSLLPAQIGAAGQLRLPAAEGESSLTPLRFSVDPRTNSIIAVGSTGDLAIIEALLLRLDERDVEQRRNTVFRLRNAPAIDVATAVNEFLRSERQLLLAAPGTLSPFQQIESEVVVVPEPVSNALIISATPRFYDEIMKLVEDLDAQPPQVLIQVLIAAVELDNFSEFGVELGLQDSLLFDRSLLGNLLTTTNTTQQSTSSGVVTNTQQTIRSATLEPGFDFNNQPLGNSGSDKSLARSSKVGGQGLTSFSLGRTSELGYGGLVLSASSESVSVLIRALQQCRRVEVLARPQVMTLDNQPAFIQVGQRVPRITGSAVNQVGQVNSISLENVGLILGVTPRVSPGGVVVMEIDAERSELGPVSEGIPVAVSEGEVIRSPTVDLAMAQTTVSANDGETVVLGGLINKRSSTTRRRVPLLAEIPVLGNIFKYDTDDVRRQELLIILTPHVVHTEADAEKFKRLEAARMHWCLADVHEIHGPTGLCNDFECPICQGKTKVIYPDADPRGMLPGEMPAGKVTPPELKLTPPLEAIPAPAPAEPLEPGAFQVPSGGPAAPGEDVRLDSGKGSQGERKG